MGSKGICQACVDRNCCRFQPFVANFSLGQIWKSRGDLQVLRLNNNLRLLPVGLVASVQYQKSYRHFEKNQLVPPGEFRCFFLDRQQNCSIYPFRPSVCRSYYCKSYVGLPEYDDQVARGDYLAFVESSLAQLALIRLGFDVATIQGCAKWICWDSGDAEPIQSEIDALWGPWWGRELELFQKSCEIVSAIDYEEFLAFFGEEEVQLRPSSWTKTLVSDRSRFPWIE